ncbi:uncharacterized protein LOC114325157 [Diabrotica virgifera virgifera]|uniref:Uncharacterized protein n=1 Tax=Diabrotica virgifera virgifera TaxID=50390 RepID=A0ABM5KCI4_DIAVI|nr:uncharacterized protein LOC114325157 [Diabrotica virgifera virgifera]
MKVDLDNNYCDAIVIMLIMDNLLSTFDENRVQDFDNYIPRYDNIPNFSHPNLSHHHNETHVLPASSHNDNFFDTFTEDDNFINTFTDIPVIPVIFTDTPLVVHVSTTEAINLFTGEEEKGPEIHKDIDTTPHGTHITDLLTSSINDIEFNNDQEYPSIIVTNVSDYGKNEGMIPNEEGKGTENMAKMETTTDSALTEATSTIANIESKGTENTAKIETTTGRGFTEPTSGIPNKESKGTENIAKIETTTGRYLTEATSVITNKKSQGTENIAKIETTTGRHLTEATSASKENKENKGTEVISKIATTTESMFKESTTAIPIKESKVTENIVKIETTTDKNVKGTTAVTANEESKGTKNVTKIETTETTTIDPTTSTHIEITTTEKTKIVPLSATFNISEVESSVNETTRNPREETEKDDPEFAEKESQESDESSEEDDEEDENMVTGILSALLGGLSKPDGGIDLDAIVGLIGSLSTQNDDGSYDFSGLTELLKGFFGGGGDGGGGSDIGAFAGGLLGAIIKGIANPPGGKGVGVLTAKLLSGILPALSVEPSDDDMGGKFGVKPGGLDIGGFLGGFVKTVFGASGGGFNPVQFIISTVSSLSNSKPKGKSKKE